MSLKVTQVPKRNFMKCFYLVGHVTDQFNRSEYIFSKKTSLVTQSCYFLFKLVHTFALNNACLAPETVCLKMSYVSFKCLKIYSSHNDLPWNIRKFIHNKLHLVNLTTDLRMFKPWSDSVWSHTDLLRMNQGIVGGQVMNNLS